jgi:hypothetical protein
VIYGFVMLILTTFAMSANQIMGQFMWIEHRNFPGGPFDYYVVNSTLWINILGTAACIVGNYLNDALLVLFPYSPLLYLFANLFLSPFYKLYRLYIIYSGDWRVVVAPFILFLGTIGISILQPSSLNDDQTAYFHQTSHVYNGSNGKCFAQLELLCKINHKLHYSMAVVDVWPQRHSDNLDQRTYYLLCSSSFGK